MPKKKVSSNGAQLALRRRKINPLGSKNSVKDYFELKSVVEYIDNTPIDKISILTLQKLCIEYGLGGKGNKISLIHKLRDHVPRLRTILNISDSSSSEYEMSWKEHLIRAKIEKLKREQKTIVLSQKPLLTLYCFLMELLLVCKMYVKGLEKIYSNKQLSYVIGCLLFLTTFLVILAEISNPFIVRVGGNVLWCLYWFGLGILSAVGFGSGCGTFVMCLGPHIASVALAVYTCNAEPPLHDQIICPEELFIDPNGNSVWSIIWKVKLELLMWGIGTSIGELFLFFVARTTRVSMNIVRKKVDIELLREEEFHMDSLLLPNFKIFCKLCADLIVHKVGFIGILICAMITNPFTDFAAFICGYFLIPFSRFFGATLIGKGVIKLLIQTITIVVACSESVTSSVLNYFVDIPYVGKKICDFIAYYLEEQKNRFIDHQTTSEITLTDRAFQLFFLSLMLYLNFNH